ncbi:MAG: nucleotidyltransferase domain-containing protein [Deltaproteobacteria bacterium]|nr:nucleotidyltransferase domain-containing protein [Deltaproteobacteria bacterium]
MSRLGSQIEVDLPVGPPEVRAAIADYVRKISTDYPDEVLSVTLYGSQARGDGEIGSDIDLFVVVRELTSTLLESLEGLAWEVQFNRGVVISDVIRSEGHFRQMRVNRFPYYRSLEREGILLWKRASVRWGTFLTKRTKSIGSASWTWG